jgi:AcrR family transcriptional regulator
MPRAGLSVEVIVAEAARLVDEVGYDRLTLAAVAEHFSVAVPSLYKHVAGIDDLQQLLAVRAVRELGASVQAAAVGRARGDALRGMAAAYRAYARAHPGRYAATLRAPRPGHAEHEAASEELLATVFAILGGYGLEGDDAVDAARTVRAALHGFTTLEMAGGFGLPRDVERSFARLVDALDTALGGWPRPVGKAAPIARAVTARRR